MIYSSMSVSQSAAFSQGTQGKMRSVSQYNVMIHHNAGLVLTPRCLLRQMQYFPWTLKANGYHDANSVITGGIATSNDEVGIMATLSTKCITH